MPGFARRSEGGARPRVSPVVVLGGLLVCAPLLFLRCASPPETMAPPVAPPDTFSAAGTQPVADRWWTAFDSDALNALVDTATAANFTLRTAWQRLQAAQATADRVAAPLFPALNASGGGQVDRSSDGPDGETLEVGLSSSYEVDVWGRIRSRARAERLRAEATRAEYQTAALTLSAEVVRTWYRLAEARSQVQLVGQQIETNETVLRLLENRLETGQVEGVDVLRQRQLVEATREQRATAETRVEELEHQLAVLVGRSPQTGVEPRPDSLPDLPSLPETGVPTDLVRQRPDVRRAHALLKAADRELAAAISDQYPRLTLSASASSTAGTAEDLFQNWAYAFAGNVLAPIFRGGELRAEVDRTAAVKEQRLYEYGQTILTAFREVEDALIREKKQREQIARLEKQVDLAQRSYRQLRVRYLNGASNYLDVLTALDEVQQLRRDLLSAELGLVEDRIALYRALAGSFETAREREN